MRVLVLAAKKSFAVAGFAVALTGAGSAIAAADDTSTTPTVPSQVGAILDADGTQGDFRSSVQGTVRSNGMQGDVRTGSQGTQDDDGFQGAYAYGSAAAFPQYR